MQIFCAMTDTDLVTMKLDRALVEGQAEALLFFAKKKERSAIRSRQQQAVARFKSSRYNFPRAAPVSPPASPPKPTPSPEVLHLHKSSPKPSYVIKVYESSDDDPDSEHYEHNIVTAVVMRHGKRKVPASASAKSSSASKHKPAPHQTTNLSPSRLIQYITKLQREHESAPPEHQCHADTRGLSLSTLLEQRRSLAMQLIRLEDVIWGLRADV